MYLELAGWIAVALETILLLIWVRSIFFTTNGTDPAGKGTAILFLLALCGWVIVQAILIMLKHSWSNIIALIMAGIPLAIVVIGLVRETGSRKKKY